LIDDVRGLVRPDWTKKPVARIGGGFFMGGANSRRSWRAFSCARRVLFSVKDLPAKTRAILTSKGHAKKPSCRIRRWLA